MSKDVSVSKKDLDLNLIDKAIGKLNMLRATVNEGSISLVDARVEDRWNLLRADECSYDELSINIEYEDKSAMKLNPNIPPVEKFG